MSRIFVPSRGPDDWKSLLADPDKHWARGYSARTRAHCWEEAEGFPFEIRRVLSQHPALDPVEALLMGYNVVEGMWDGTLLKIDTFLLCGKMDLS
jgi:hypothetical protein